MHLSAGKHVLSSDFQIIATLWLTWFAYIHLINQTLNWKNLCDSYYSANSRLHLSRDPTNEKDAVQVWDCGAMCKVDYIVAEVC